MIKPTPKPSSGISFKIGTSTDSNFDVNTRSVLISWIFYCPSAHLAIELDGSQHLEQQAYDDQRSTYLTNQGVTRILRFTSDVVLTNTLAVLEEIGRALT